MMPAFPARDEEFLIVLIVLEKWGKAYRTCGGGASKRRAGGGGVPDHVK
jgi:hypothetical protein